MSKALQACPESGKLWAEAIRIEPSQSKKAKAMDALKALDSHPLVALEMAKVFWQEKKHERTRRWLETSVKLGPEIGDTWAYSYLFALTHSDEKEVEQVQNECIKAEP